ncbi:MAG: hypothetical protein ABSE73_17155 [Planctomycetota bacterium]
MNAHEKTILAPGPDLLARYLSAYLRTRPASSFEFLWGLGTEEQDGLWCRLLAALAAGAGNLNRVVAEELGEAEKAAIAETLTPLIFALPLRSYPAELRCARAGSWLALTLRHVSPRPAPPALPRGKKLEEQNGLEQVGCLPACLTPALAGYVRKVLRWPAGQRSNGVVAVSSGGRRRRVRITLLARERGFVVRFLEQLPAPADE